MVEFLKQSAYHMTQVSAVTVKAVSSQEFCLNLASSSNKSHLSRQAFTGFTLASHFGLIWPMFAQNVSSCLETCS